MRDGNLQDYFSGMLEYANERVKRALGCDAGDGGLTLAAVFVWEDGEVEKVMKRKKIAAICFAAALQILSGCGKAEKPADSVREVYGTEKQAEAVPEETVSVEPETEPVKEPEVLRFLDVFGQEYETEICENAAKHPYDLDCFIWEDGVLSYQGDADYSYRLGVDVSHHQGNIDWQKVKSQGYEFAFLRIGYRGYGTEGLVCPDKTFCQNIEQAHAAGMDVGVYFFSQAVNEEEALEEAEFVLDRLLGYELELPVVYDPESILDAEARTDNVPGRQFTQNTKVFCEKIRSEGYEPMVYSNMLWEAFEFDMEELAGYPVWYADYEPKPQTPYDFCFWQYTNEGKVLGISGDTDLNIQMIKRN